MNATQSIAVEILKIEGIYTLERREDSAGGKGREGGRGRDRERFLI